MPVYVDDMYKSPVGEFGKMKMSHLIADTRDELLKMVDKIGVQQKWIQYPGTAHEHFDICLSKRKLAIQNGAIEISWLELGRAVKARETTGVLMIPTVYNSLIKLPEGIIESANEKVVDLSEVYKKMKELIDRHTVFPVITLYQPWATWVIREWKPIETRTHNRFACLKGHWVLIHAGAKTDDSELTRRNPYLTKEQIIYKPDEVVNGAILGMAYCHDWGLLNINHSKAALIDCGPPFTRYGNFLKEIVIFPEPIPEKGELGIWYYDLLQRKKVKKPTSQTKLF